MAKSFVIVDSCVFIKAKKAIQLMQKYISGQQIITVPDCLIAAISIVTGFPLLTYNHKDFSFIEGIEIYN